ncbi:MAG: CDP-alcohol phosphatidyltransferase family protein, partial [Candidatus Heimdallarchaeaceae archaeon]
MGKIKNYIKNLYSERDGEHFIKKSEPWSVTFIGRVLGIPLARGFVYLNITPNIITIFTVPFAFLAGVAFFYNYLILGALLYFISFILDCSDGVVARLTNTASRYGERLDYYTDILNNVFMYFGLWYSQFYLQDMWFLGGAVIAFHYAVMAFGYVFLKKLTYKTISPRICSYYMHADEGFLTFGIAPIT